MIRVNSTEQNPKHRIDELYSFRNPMDVCRFLDDHPFLVPLLEEASEKIRAYFGHSVSNILLEVVYDPEDPDNTQLVAFVGTSDSPKEAFLHLQELDAGWWLLAMNRAQGKFHINVECR